MPRDESIQQMRVRRDQIMKDLLALTDEECAYPAAWNGITRNVSFLLRLLAAHDLDHAQHIQRLLQGRGRKLTEAQLILGKAQELRGEIEALLLSVSDEDFEVSDADGGWSMARVAEHLQSGDAHFHRLIQEALTAARTTPPT